jgi:hypothetical protein
MVAGCGGDNGGTNGNGEETPPPRLVAIDTVAAPSMLDANDPVWDQIDSVEVEVGFSSTYGQNPQLYKDTLLMKVIKTADMLYIWANWRDGYAHLWGNFSRIKAGLTGIWEQINFNAGNGGEDAIFIAFDAGDNGEEGADCASMCHAVQYGMATTGGGHVDVWSWKSSTTNPGFLAEDQWWSSAGNYPDPPPAINPQTVYTVNWFNFTKQPEWMHEDDTAFHEPFLYAEDIVDFDGAEYMGWSEANYKMPGYIIDSTIYSLAERDDRWDVLAISHYDSLSTWNRWTVVMARPLTGLGANDVDLAGLDSIQVTVAVSSNHTDAEIEASLGYDWLEHSGSVPFYLILNPPE